MSTASASPSIWRNRRFLLYATGNSINNVGTSLYLFALPLLIYSLTGSAVSMSVMMFVEAVPLLFSPFIGAVVDRISRRTMTFAALSWQAMCSLAVPLLYLTGHLELWMIYLFGGLTTFGLTALLTTQFALVPSMFGEQRIEARAALNTCFTVTTLLGPTLAGLLISHLDYYHLLLLNSVTYLAPIVFCIWTRIPHESLGGVRSLRQVVDDTRDGLSFMRRHPVLLNVMGAAIVTGLASDAGFLLVLLIYLKDELLFPDRWVGWLLVVQGAGLFVGSLLPPRFKHVPMGSFLLRSMLLVAFASSLFLLPLRWLAPIALFLYAMSRISASITNNLLIQENVPNELLGRAIGSLRLVLSFTMMVSPLLLGQVVSRFGSTGGFLTILAVTLGAAAVVRFGPLGKNTDHKENPTLGV